MAAVLGKYADGFVKAGRDKLLPSGRIVNIQRGGDVVHVHGDWLVQEAHVVCVEADETKRCKVRPFGQTAL